ncbi:cytochrome c biogenesis CcdA family protein [Curtobacterium flaccumfaciens]|uniref:cytochrome c biogenesis CcdA family protein n=1 Tax=Curtobacterium flaccumfaciens TaxID=2035 RepID=UPI00387A3EB9
MTLQETVFSGQMLAAVPIAMLAGLISFASPCVLPLVPGYLGFVSGSASTVTTRRTLGGAALFVVGFGLVFVAYGAAFGTAGAWLFRWQDVIIRILGLIVIIMGAAFIGLFRPLQRTVRTSWRPRPGLLGAPLLGATFGLGWTPCFGPTLATITALSLDSGTGLRGAALGLAYCLGLGIPFIIVAAGFGWASRTVTFLRTHIRAINLLGGCILIATGIAMLTGVWTLIMSILQGMIANTTVVL